MLQNSCDILIASLILVFIGVCRLNAQYKQDNCDGSEGKEELPGYELVFVQALWRHGDRAPNGTYPTDPNQEDKWRYGWQELTPRGMAEMEKLGKIFRQRYVLERQFLNEQYTPKEIYVRSTDLNRILASAQAVMAGLFSSERLGLDIPSKQNSSTWPSHWIPVPVHAPVPFLKDRLVPWGLGNCPRGDQIITEIRNSSMYKQIVNDNQHFLEFVSEKAGVSPAYTPDTMWTLYDSLWRERYNNMPQPDWLNATVYEHIRQLCLYVHPRYVVFAPWALSDEYIRLIGGPILKQIIDSASLKLECLESQNNACESIVNDVQKIRDLKFYFYSTHGFALTSVSYTLNINDKMLGIPNEEPPQSASLIFELWTKKQAKKHATTAQNSSMIRILFRESVYVNDYQAVTSFVPGCNGSDFCSFEAFKQSRGKFLPSEVNKECGM